MLSPSSDYRLFARESFLPATLTRAAPVTQVTWRLLRLSWHRKNVAKDDRGDYVDWDSGREGYVSSRTTPSYAPAPKSAVKPKAERHLLSIRAEERFGSLVAAAGTIWAVYVATYDYAGLWRFQIAPPGPIEVCGLGVLAWLHAKWRRSVNAG